MVRGLPGEGGRWSGASREKGEGGPGPPEHGRKEEIERGFRFIEALARLLELPRRRVAVVPGNHDINWNKSSAYFEDCEGDGVPPVEPYFRKLVFYQQLFERFYEGEPGITFTEDEPWTLFEHPDLGVVVAGLNSVIAESHRVEDHHGLLGERQLRAFAEKLFDLLGVNEAGESAGGLDFLRVFVPQDAKRELPPARTRRGMREEAEIGLRAGELGGAEGSRSSRRTSRSFSASIEPAQLMNCSAAVSRRGSFCLAPPAPARRR